MAPVQPAPRTSHFAPTAADYRTWDQAHVWHPFTPHAVYADEDPLYVASGEGNYLIDVDGKRYLDGVASLWCNAVGHRHPRLDAALVDQAGRIAHATMLGNATLPAIELAKRLADLAPGELTRVFYSDNGSTAVEVALKMAYQYWKQSGVSGSERRAKFLTLTDAYHGDTIGSVSLGGIDLFHDRYRALLFPTVKSPSPYCYRCPLGLERATCGIACLSQLEAAIAEHGPELAAVVIEPGVQGAAGMIVQPEGFLRRVREACDRAGTLLIVDEVAVGMGRSGELFASDREGVVPDFLCLAKMLTGGYLPLAATLTTERIFQAFVAAPSDGKTFYHGHTFTGNPLAAAVALATLDVIEEEILPGLSQKTERFSAAVNQLRAVPGVGDVRIYGLAAGVELVADPTSKRPFPTAQRTGMKVCTAAKRRGVFLRPLGDVIILMPPLSITDDEIDRLVSVIRESIVEVLG